ncbi:adenylyl-sulfate reductase [Caproiciproducens sp. NJN-50]|uniref:phosphoadenosine phosphosulfate reductase family protein n=1 Tax=Caproiciproducens sp. NJN-50 TaxID=2507162 RepID=UPI000FFE29AF|nr:phosphoadenosine phosphosulfate reductase family protein [Caproiciproducens sp. NJN-50]QAT48558.1 adenylyl-sulfate reductase [Caproiciproducens sp. NJN-50]
MDLEQTAIKRIQYAAEISETYYNAPLIVTYSGGKDSEVNLELTKRAGIDFEVQHNHTTADAPETVRHVRETFHRLELEGIQCTLNLPRYKWQPASIWGLIPSFGPPTRIFRWCCKIFKESGGKNRCVTTGVRWDESTGRKANRGALEAGRDNLFFDDNDESRKDFEACPIKGTTTINPIIEWKNSDVWSFARSEHLCMNPLYECGFSRVGCVGCPMAQKHRYDEFRRYPKYELNYRLAFGRMIKRRKAAGKPTQWKTADEVFDWWMEDKNLDGQIEFEGVK